MGLRVGVPVPGPYECDAASIKKEKAQPQNILQAIKGKSSNCGKQHSAKHKHQPDQTNKTENRFLVTVQGEDRTGQDRLITRLCRESVGARRMVM